MNGTFNTLTVSAQVFFGDELKSGADAYRYGFGGQEKDDEIYGEGKSYTAEFWQYDSRLGRRWNGDPMAWKFPWMSTYATFNNNPIRFVDPDGRIPWDKTVSTCTRIGDGFGIRPSGMHRGQDLSAKVGTAVNSFASGTVVKVAYSESWGNYVVVSHGDNYYSLYAHLEDNSIIVKEGVKVKDGQQLGGVGNTGRSYGDHLHLEVGQAESLNKFLSRENRDQTRTDPVQIGDLEKVINPIPAAQSNDQPNVPAAQPNNHNVPTSQEQKE